MLTTHSGYGHFLGHAHAKHMILVIFEGNVTMQRQILVGERADCDENDWSSGFTDDLPDLEADQNSIKDGIIHEKYGEFICQAKSNLSDLISHGFTRLV